MTDLSVRLRALPAVDRVTEALTDRAARPLVVRAARRALDDLRNEIIAGAEAPAFEVVVARAESLLEEEERGLLRPLLNATGVMVHTNLGRAPLGKKQLDAVNEIAGGYSNLEYDLNEGGRGSRYGHAADLLRALTGAEAALVVNNNAAAVLLVLAALCAAREVIISRGELIEIGGEFRIPDVMALSGARLVEVGTTNRTHMRDYERAIGEHTAAILKVHPSNYKVTGFTKEVAARDLARLARGRGVTLIHDLGSGYVARTGDTPWAAAEPAVEVALGQGPDLVTFSGDKLLGGPQAGVIAGRSELVDQIGRNPLLRALRVDKMTLAALEATLAAYLGGSVTDLPLWRMALTPTDELENRARLLAEALADIPPLKAEAVPTASVTGGGSLPGGDLPSWGVALTHSERTTDAFAMALRLGSSPVIGRIEDDRLMLDLRTVPPEDDQRLLALVRAAAS